MGCIKKICIFPVGKGAMKVIPTEYKSYSITESLHILLKFNAA